jgi:4-carboxymuconolactone decarboxylase
MRIPHSKRDDFSVEEQAVFDRMQKKGPPANIYMLLSHSPKVANALLEVSEALRASKVVTAELRELVTLHTTLLIGGEYEYNQHWNAAIALGIDRAKIEALKVFETSPLFTGCERAALRVSAELAVPPFELTAATWDALRAEFPDRAIVEILIVIGWYQLGARFTGALDVEMDPWYRKL